MEIKRPEAEALALGDYECNIYKLLLPAYVKAEKGNGRRRPIHIAIAIKPDELNKHKATWKRPHFTAHYIEGASINGNAWGSSGYAGSHMIEHYDLAADLEYCEGWDAESFKKLLEVCDLWHLNGTRAGCEHQMANWDLAAELEVAGKKKRANWVTATEHPDGCLSKPCEVCGYRYGSAWLFEELPREVIAYVEALPDAGEPCAWRRL